MATNFDVMATTSLIKPLHSCTKSLTSTLSGYWCSCNRMPKTGTSKLLRATLIFVSLKALSASAQTRISVESKECTETLFIYLKLQSYTEKSNLKLLNTQCLNKNVGEGRRSLTLTLIFAYFHIDPYANTKLFTTFELHWT